ncbi:hypothetical protein OSB04_024117 [Centaurea solstitialis]|uniref:Uncharacterized protein n=1 Tax=Centaurea solstitialis TaxID=347529 RepID=A0AA38SKH3_9ASTR|nr:hypothetical protein OSB04_024117 [Centaurea solstitialis]
MAASIFASVSAHSENNPEVQTVNKSQALTFHVFSFIQNKYESVVLVKKPNNCYLSPSSNGFPEIAFPLLEILRNQSMNYALTATKTVSETYLTQFLLSSYVCNLDDAGICIVGYASHTKVKSLVLVSSSLSISFISQRFDRGRRYSHVQNRRASGSDDRGSAISTSVNVDFRQSSRIFSVTCLARAVGYSLTYYQGLGLVHVERSLKTGEENYRKRLKIIQIIIDRTSMRDARGSDFSKSSSPSSPSSQNLCGAHQSLFICTSAANSSKLICNCLCINFCTKSGTNKWYQSKIELLIQLILSSSSSSSLFLSFSFNGDKTNTSYLSIGFQSETPTLNREVFKEWKIRMINFLEGIHPRITEFLHNPPYIPVKLIPRVPATASTAEVPEYYQPKVQTE